ncbi:GNAT family N-acetyltransferase [Paenibacillus sp. GCM10027627]|uniref:GNAT family N-acetyltransferase n=1 Tax=unclassified Paenibacillus TaxID=185978 RepID=UPI00362C1189
MTIVETPRLLLRKFRQEDAASLHPIFSDAETMAFYPAPFDWEKTEHWIEKNQNRYIHDGYGLWAMCLKETGEVIGDCGLIKQQVDDKEETEIGYHLHKKYWSQGLATEAAKACRDYGFYTLGLAKLISIIDPEHSASIRVAERIGLTFEKQAFIFDRLHSIYSVYRNQH